MGFSSDMQYLIPMGFVVILFKLVIIDFKKNKVFKYFILGMVIYIILKIILLNYFKYNEDFIGMTIVMLIIALFYIYFKIYIKINSSDANEDIDYELLKIKVKMGYLICGIFIIFPLIIRVLNLLYLYRGEIKNFYLILFEYWLSSLIILIASKLGSKIIKKVT